MFFFYTKFLMDFPFKQHGFQDSLIFRRMRFFHWNRIIISWVIGKNVQQNLKNQPFLEALRTGKNTPCHQKKVLSIERCRGHSHKNLSLWLIKSIQFFFLWQFEPLLCAAVLEATGMMVKDVTFVYSAACHNVMWEVHKDFFTKYKLIRVKRFLIKVSTTIFEGSAAFWKFHVFGYHRERGRNESPTANSCILVKKSRTTFFISSFKKRERKFVEYESVIDRKFYG